MAGTPELQVLESRHPSRLRIHVLFTTIEETRKAFCHAAKSISGLDAELHLILTPIVPFPLPLDQPPTSADFAEKQIHEVSSGVDSEYEAFVYLCRDPLRTLTTLLPPRSMIVVGTGRWFLGKSRRLVSALRRCGHQVMTV
jgi:hypothetical protein